MKIKKQPILFAILSSFIFASSVNAETYFLNVGKNINPKIITESNNNKPSDKTKVCKIQFKNITPYVDYWYNSGGFDNIDIILDDDSFYQFGNVEQNTLNYAKFTNAEVFGTKSVSNFYVGTAINQFKGNDRGYPTWAYTTGASYTIVLNNPSLVKGIQLRDYFEMYGSKRSKSYTIDVYDCSDNIVKSYDRTTIGSTVTPIYFE